MNSIEAIGEQIAFRYGLVPRPDWPTQIENALNLLSRKLGVSPTESCQRILHDSNALRQVAGFLTIDESYFFRHENHFEQLLRYVDDQLKKRDASSRISILSAGCAFGSEPYSLAIVLKERIDPRCIDRIEITACDLSLRAIESAREGVFHQWSFRETNAMTKQLYFRELSADRYQLRYDIRKMVSFHHLSIQEQLNKTAARSLDAILFRNVGVYLHTVAVSELYQSVTRVLRPNGLLFVSATDPRPAKEQLLPLESEDATIYQLYNDSSPSYLPPSDFDLIEKNNGFASGKCRATNSRKEKPKRRGQLGSTEQGLSDSIVTARMLADRGDYDRALALCHRVIDKETECGKALRLRGELRLLSLRPREAVEDFERALSLAPDDPIYRYWYAMGLEAAGNFGTALGEVRRLIDHLASLPRTDLLSDGETVAGELLLAATSLERNLE